MDRLGGRDGWIEACLFVASASTPLVAVIRS